MTMTRHERLRQICEQEGHTGYSPEKPLGVCLEALAVLWFTAGIASWYDDDTMAVREALIELYDTGQISEYEHSK
jgi:hypothetical protein